MKISYCNGLFDVDEVIKELWLKGLAEQICTPVIVSREVKKMAHELDVDAAEEDLQKVADNFRKQNGLFTAHDTMKFLRNAGVTIEDFQAFCETEALIDLVKERLATDAKVRQFFMAQRGKFDSARVSIILVEDENYAKEIIRQVIGGTENFCTLAREHSLDEETRYGGGYVGMVARETFPAQISERIFNANPGEVLGPFALQDLFWVILVDEVKRAKLDHSVKQAVKEHIFSEWTAEFVKQGIGIRL
jgi:peptidylprolyl isomerase